MNYYRKYSKELPYEKYRRQHKPTESEIAKIVWFSRVNEKKKPRNWWSSLFMSLFYRQHLAYEAMHAKERLPDKRFPMRPRGRLAQDDVATRIVLQCTKRALVLRTSLFPSISKKKEKSNDPDIIHFMVLFHQKDLPVSPHIMHVVNRVAVHFGYTFETVPIKDLEEILGVEKVRVMYQYQLDIQWNYHNEPICCVKYPRWHELPLQTFCECACQIEELPPEW